MVLALDSGNVCVENFGMIGIPSTDSPEVTLFKDADGVWRMEDSEGMVRGLRNGQPFEFGGQSYVFSCPSTNDLTASIGTAVQRRAPTLKFVVSSDEDFVELSMEYENKSIALGSRAHNYLLLTLARQKLADSAEQIAPASCGWMDKDQLAGGLRMTPQQIDGEIFRIRRHFASHGVPESSSVVERRERTRLIRLGLDRVLVAARLSQRALTLAQLECPSDQCVRTDPLRRIVRVSCYHHLIGQGQLGHSLDAAANGLRRARDLKPPKLSDACFFLGGVAVGKRLFWTRHAARSSRAQLSEREQHARRHARRCGLFFRTKYGQRQYRVRRGQRARLKAFAIETHGTFCAIGAEVSRKRETQAELGCHVRAVVARAQQPNGRQRDVIRHRADLRETDDPAATCRHRSH